eukprot:365592-Chlamydomonas_euryale.AAC.12
MLVSSGWPPQCRHFPATSTDLYVSPNVPEILHVDAIQGYKTAAKLPNLCATSSMLWCECALNWSCSGLAAVTLRFGVVILRYMLWTCADVSARSVKHDAKHFMAIDMGGFF